jgi:hypothetical protein
VTLPLAALCLRLRLFARVRVSAPPVWRWWLPRQRGPRSLECPQFAEQQQLLPPTVGRGEEPILFRHRGKLIDHASGFRAALTAILAAAAPTDVSFHTWAESVVSPEAAELVSAFAFIPTFEADAGRLSAAFVHERLRRVVQPDVVRYVIGGWQTLVSRLAHAARDLGVMIDERHTAAKLPAAPVVVATSPAAAGRLLARPPLGAEGTRVALFDLALDDAARLPSGLLDVDERLYLARYTAFDPSLAPSGQELIQIVCGC